MKKFITIGFIAMGLFIYSCTSSPKKSNTDISKVKEQNLTKEVTESETQSLSEVEELIEYAHNFNGNAIIRLNNIMMEQLIQDYLEEYHLQDIKEPEEYIREVKADIAQRTFYFSREYPSDISAYALEEERVYQQYRTYHGWEEEHTEEEIKKHEEETKAAYAAINPELKKEYLSNYIIASGTWDTLSINEDIIEVSFEFIIGNVDAISYNMYGEDAYRHFGEEKWDEYTISVLELFYNVGTRSIYSKEDLMLLNKDYLPYLRNWFYARKGYRFKSDKMKSYFSAKKWYTPTVENSEGILSDVEEENIKLIKELEK